MASRWRDGTAVKGEGTMELQMIRLLYAYNRWVNERLLAAAARVPDQRRHERFGASFDSIHDTLAHILGAQITWLSRWNGVSPKRMITAADFGELDEIRTRWAAHQQDVDAFLTALTAERLGAPLAYTNTSGKPFAYPLWQQMLHVVNHGTHHRAELADMVTRAGQTVPPTDLLVYFDEEGAAR
jgi:uncharacterized damage-inducible protein DinB